MLLRRALFSDAFAAADDTIYAIRFSIFRYFRHAAIIFFFFFRCFAAAAFYMLISFSPFIFAAFSYLMLLLRHMPRCLMLCRC